MFSQRIPLFYVVVSSVASILISFIVLQKIANFHQHNIAVPAINKNCDYTFERVPGYKFVRPLLLAEPACESENYSALKLQLISQIESFNASGITTNVSVYLQDLKSDEWMSISPEINYNPGSLMKVPLLISFLRMEETTPGFLNKPVTITRVYANINRNPVFVSETVKVGQTYTIRELLRRMIVFSDNEATIELCNYLDYKKFQKTFTDFGLPEPDTTNMDYPITARNFSTFLEGLYNAGYLTISSSEYANALLTQSTFKEGIVNGLPPQTVVAHKFGEAGNDQQHELHESAIVFYNNSPYLLTVMTRGPELKKLPQVLSTVSKTVFGYMGRVNG